MESDGDEPIGLTLISGDDQELVSLENVRKCRHGSYKVDQSLVFVECSKCGEKVNPILILCDIIKKGSYAYRYIAKAKECRKKIEDRNRVKCKHCGKFTPILKRGLP